MVPSQQGGYPASHRNLPAASQDQESILYQGTERPDFQSDTYQLQQDNTPSIPESQHDINDQPSSSRTRRDHQQRELFFPDQSTYSDQEMLYTLQGQTSQQGYQPTQMLPYYPHQNFPQQKRTSTLIPSQQYLPRPYVPTVRFTHTTYPQHGHQRQQAQDLVTSHTSGPYQQDSSVQQFQAHGIQRNLTFGDARTLTGHAAQFHRPYNAPVHVPQELLNQTRFQSQQIRLHISQEQPVSPAPLHHQTSVRGEQSQTTRPSSSQIQFQPPQQQEGQFIQRMTRFPHYMHRENQR